MVSKEQIKNLLLKIKQTKGADRLNAIREMLNLNKVEKPVDK